MNDSSRRSDLFRRILRQRSSAMPPTSPSSRFLASTGPLSPPRDAAGRLCRGQGVSLRFSFGAFTLSLPQPSGRVSAGCPWI